MAPPILSTEVGCDTPSPGLSPSGIKRALRVPLPDLPEVEGKTLSKMQCPAFFAKKLGVTPANIATMEINSSSRSMYATMARYLALIAVDATEGPPRKVDATVVDPESPGKLRSLSSASVTWAGDEEDRVPDFYIGFGYARARTSDGRDVFVCHYARGPPAKHFGMAYLYRVIAIFAVEAVSLRKLCEDALEWQTEYEKNKRKVQQGKYMLMSLSIDDCGEVNWRQHGIKDARPLDSIFLKKGQKEAIVNDFKSFSKQSTKEWYLKHGLPYRRSYLFYGPPGVGKTSLIRGLAGELEMTTCFLCLADKKMGNRQLQDALMTIPRPSMIVLEDVDVLFNEERKAQTHSTLTFSGILNALDGLISAEKVLTVMTTNHIERLDPALIRAGRVDRRFEFSAPDRSQLCDLFSSYYPECEKDMPGNFADIVFGREEPAARSIATLQQLFVYCREKTADECMATIPEFFMEFYPKDRRDLKRNLYV